MSFQFDLDIIKNKDIAFIKIESESEIFYRKIINIIDNSYKKYEGVIFSAISTSHVIVIKLYLNHFKDKNNKIADNLENLVNKNVKSFIQEIFNDEEEIKIFFRKLSRTNKK